MRENKVKELSDVDHVKIRPSMYVGSTEFESFDRWVLNEESEKFEFRRVAFVPGVLKMFDEIISNSIDEGFRTNFRYANRINVQVAPDSIVIRDNGRGIPTSPAEGSSMSQAEVALTRLRAGANFGDDKVVSIGTHGLGASLVNILSSKFVAWTDDGKNRLELTCSDGLNSKKVKLNPSKKDLGTFIQFWPDFSRFGCNDISGDLEGLIRKRVHDLAACFPMIEFRLDGKRIHGKKFKEYIAMIGEHPEILETENMKVAVLTSDEPNQISFLNGIDTYEGGTHVNFVRDQIVNQLLEKLNKAHKKLKLAPADIRNRLNLVLITNSIPKPKFRSQSKEYVTNQFSDYAGLLDGIAESNLVKRILKNPTLIDPIIETKRLKIEAAEAVALKAAGKKAKKIKVAKHVPASGLRSEATLYLTEGESASGMLTDVRDAKRHGSYPLRGKPLNAFGRKATDVNDNKEYFELMAILGLEHGKYDAGNLGYGNIAIMPDADVDGHSIAASLLAFFSRWPQLFKEGRISIVRCPIMTLCKSGKTKKIYDLSDYQDLLSSGEVDASWEIKYYKGLGSLTKEQYRDMVHDPVKDVISLNDSDMKMLDVAFGPDASKRKSWLLPAA